MDNNMITPKDADALAHSTIENYVACCHCRTPQDMANVLMKLASMSGLAMMAVVGKEEAIDRLTGTTNHLYSVPESTAAATWIREEVH